MPTCASRTASGSCGCYGGRWRLSAYAFCASPRITGPNPQPWLTVDPELQADGALSDPSGMFASDRCPGVLRTHGLGGGGGLSDGGPSWLRTIAPHRDLRGVDVGMTGPLQPSIGGMVAHQTCAK